MANTKKTTSGCCKPSSSKTNAKSTTKKTNLTEMAQENCRLSDYDIISDVLGSHKNLVKLYGTALCETDSEHLKKIISSQMTECAVDQFDAFKYMNDRNMYKVEPAPVQKIKNARNKYGKSIQNFCSGCGDKQ